MSFDPVIIETQDLQARAVTRTLLQFRQSVVFLALLRALTKEIQELSDAISGTMQGFTPTDATGEQLNILGRIVGQVKLSFDYGLIDWFIPDTQYHEPDHARAWTTGAPLGTIEPIGEALFRNLIEFKVQRNHTQNCSLPEVIQAIYTAFELPVTFYATADPLDMGVVIPGSAPRHMVNWLTQEGDTPVCDSVYLPPYLATWRIIDNLNMDDIVLQDDATSSYLQDDVTGYFLTPDDAWPPGT